MIIEIEGADGCGKSSVGRAIAHIMDAKLIHFPNDEGYTGPAIRAYLRGRWGIYHESTGEPDPIVGPLAFQGLQVMNRLETLADLNTDYGRAKFVFVRYWHSAVVYGTSDGLSEEFLTTIHEWMPKIDLSILLDVSVETSLQRMGVRGTDLERYEKREKLAQVIDGYRRVWDNGDSGKFVVVNAEQDFGNVLADTMRAVRQCGL